MGEELLKTGTAMCLGLVLGGRSDTAADCDSGLEGVGEPWLLTLTLPCGELF